MPTYEYRCPECGRTCEVRVKLIEIDRYEAHCECGGDLKRVFTPPAVAFKGDGFYSSSRKRALKKELDRRTEEKQK